MIRRLYLSNLKPSDVTKRYVGWMNDYETTKYLEARFSNRTEKGITKWVRKNTCDKNCILQAIRTEFGGSHIGNIKLFNINRIHGNAEVSIMIGKEYWGHGYGTEAIRLISNYAFNQSKLYKLTAECYINNIGSWTAFLNAGFETEGRKRSQYLFNGHRIDSFILGMVKP